MAANKLFNVGPVAVTTTYTTNIFNPATATGGVNSGSSSMYVLIRWISITNKTATACTFRLYKGATGANAAGTELYYDVSVPPNSSFERAVYWRFDAADFLVGGAQTTLSLVLTMGGEIGVAG